MPRAREAAQAIACAILGLLIAASPVIAQTSSPDREGLVRVDTRRFDNAAIAPDVNFSGYSKVMVDPTEASFQRNWLRDYNNSTTSMGRRLSDDDAREMLAHAQTAFHDALAEAYTAAGYQVVTTPGEDVLRIRTTLSNIEVAAPDVLSAGRTRSFSREAGEATLVIEARDAMSGALLARAVDRRYVGENRLSYRDRTSNIADFRNAFRTWARKSAEALDALRALPAPAATAGG